MVENPFKSLLEMQAETTEKFCDKHELAKIKILRTNKSICPTCEYEKSQSENQRLVDEFAKADKENERKYYLNKFSLFDQVLAEATLENYNTPTLKESEKLKEAQRMCEEWLEGNRNNIVFQGNAGTGKSHLAFGIIKKASEANGEIAIFMNVADLFSLLKSDFNQEAAIVDKLTAAKYLVLDDLGMENNTEWTFRVLYSILNRRSNTIITTNLTASQIETRYGRPFLDRVMKGVDKKHVLKFDDIESKRRQYF